MLFSQAACGAAPQVANRVSMPRCAGRLAGSLPRPSLHRAWAGNHNVASCQNGTSSLVRRCTLFLSFTQQHGQTGSLSESRRLGPGPWQHTPPFSRNRERGSYGALHSPDPHSVPNRSLSLVPLHSLLCAGLSQHSHSAVQQHQVTQGLGRGWLAGESRLRVGSTATGRSGAHAKARMHAADRLAASEF